ncbi:SDR family oxidoreductase [Nocardioides sp. GY 10127]|uniref:SDR family NAD(P)-dependent oxidoreductase n=1 Tax=Nocardioides sp. GY 10127 TaxID=2569762 RepID=UPI0010A8C3F6|nr:SDR family oxidoreductase [Nocardioides sp. GY 10127]TIC81776.1 SDR family oxidoreductase [Nocardioides sp. GY 10127]
MPDGSILVIGGASGFGRAVARHLAREGRAVHVTSRDEKKAASVAADLAEETGTFVAGHAVDVMDADALADLLGTVAAEGPLAHVVSTAGGASAGGFLDGSLDDVLGPVRDKFEAGLRLARAAAPLLAEGGSLTLTAGAGGKPHQAAGAVLGNADLRMLVQGLAVELAPRVRVNAVAPGWTVTPLWRDLDPADVEATRRAISAQVPLGRTATVEEVAAAFLFLLGNGFVTGQTLTVDGGWELV